MIKVTSVSQTILKLLRFSRRLWVRVALMALLAVLAAGVAPILAPVIPKEISTRFSPEAVMPILTVLASGMLAVSTFSLNVMVTAHRAAAAQATPRAHRILLSDTTTQTVLATFIGAFVYSLSAIILFKSHLIAPGTSVTMLGFTVIVVVLVILAMLRWIDHLSDLGSMDATLQATEAEARPCLMQTRHAPALGCSPLGDDAALPADTCPIAAPGSGYVQFIDAAALDQALSDKGATLHLSIVPGDFVLRGQPVAHAVALNPGAAAALLDHIIFGDIRTFEQDAAYGLLVLSEIASRALSPGINDPGTAIDVIARQERLLWDWATTPANDGPPAYPRVFLRALSADSLIDNAFGSIARDGAGMIEVAKRLQNALAALAAGPDQDMSKAAKDMVGRAREHALTALTLDGDKAQLKSNG